MNLIGVERSLILIASGFAVRAIATYRTNKRKRTEFETHLVDGAILEAVFNPRSRDQDDPDLLAEMRDTFAHLNRRAYAEEFWGVTDQLVALNEKLEEPQQATLRRAVIRMIQSSDRWLQLIGARTSVRLGITESVEPLNALLEGYDHHYSEEVEPPTPADERYRQELKEALGQLKDAAPSPP